MEKSEPKNGRCVEWNGTDKIIRWYKEGVLHRENGPAIEAGVGFEAWYVNGKLHREDGPAVKQSSGGKGEWEWYLYGVRYSEEEFYSYIEKKKLKGTLQSDLIDKENEIKKSKI